MLVGVLALQGAYAAHQRSLAELGHAYREVREPADLERVDGLVLPGGESSVHLALIERFGLERPLRDFARSGRPMLAICAGLILAAREVSAPLQRSLDWLDIAVERNSYGRQVHSSEARSDDGRFALVFIRAPRIVRAGDVTVLASYRADPVLVRRDNVVGATFHPELTADGAVHRIAFGMASAGAGLQLANS